MSDLPEGAFLTKINGKQCTAVPRNPRSAAPVETTSQRTQPTTTKEQPQPTRSSGNSDEDTQGDQREPETTSAPQPDPTSAPPRNTAPVQDDGDDGEDREDRSSESTELETTTSSRTVSAPQAQTTTPSILSSSPPLRTDPPAEQDREEGDPASQDLAETSTSSVPDQSLAEDPIAPTQVPGPSSADDEEQVSSALPILPGADEGGSSTILISTATFLAGVSSLASPSVSSFFSPPSSPSASSRAPVNSLTPSFVSFPSPSQPSPVEPSNDAALLADSTPSPDGALTSTLANGKIITIGIASTSSRDQDGSSETQPVDPPGGARISDSSGSDAPGPSPALIGGIVGGIVALALLVILLWFCRRRKRSKRTRFSTRFSTRMSMPPGAEKRRTYEFDSGSVGPTPKRERFAAAFGYHFNKFGGLLGHDNESKVNLNRGNSQFLEGLPSHSRGQSLSSSFESGTKLSARDRFLDWWSRLKEDVNFNWRLRNGHMDNWAIRNMMEKDTGDMEPDFLALLGKDEKHGLRTSMHSRGASVSSIDRFLGDLGMDMDNTNGPSANPFSDSNAVAPLGPFSDENAVRPTQRPPQTYVAEVRRSRGASLGATRASNLSTVYRDSIQSNRSFEARRNKCRSDPFDLELDHRKLPSFDNIGPVPRMDSIYGLPPRPGSLRNGHASVNSSRYTHGSMGDWSDPGPDVGRTGPSSATSISAASKSPGATVTASSHKSEPSSGSQESGSVGKAM